MDFAPHWATMYKCNLCGEIPDIAPLYHCQFQHQFCANCYEDLKKNYKGNVREGCTCPTCNVSGKFQKSKINTDFLRKLKIKPGIGRPFRYSSKVVNSRRNGYTTTDKTSRTSHAHTCDSKCSEDHCYCNNKGDGVTIEDLFQLPTNQIQKLLRKKSNRSLNPIDENDSTDDESLAEENHESLRSDQSKIYCYQSKEPIVCPHSSCQKTVAVSAFVNHFKYEHKNIPIFNAERGKELTLPLDLTIIEHSSDTCLAMITVYEINKIDVVKSKSSKSVLRTCNKFSQSIPISTFWLMVSGSQERRSFVSYAYYWLYTNTDETYHCTIEIASENDTFNFSTFCYVNNTGTKTLSNIPVNLNCLLLSHNAFVALLKEGLELKLRVTIH